MKTIFFVTDTEDGGKEVVEREVMGFARDDNDNYLIIRSDRTGLLFEGILFNEHVFFTEAEAQYHLNELVASQPSPANENDYCF